MTWRSFRNRSICCNFGSKVAIILTFCRPRLRKTATKTGREPRKKCGDGPGPERPVGVRGVESVPSPHYPEGHGQASEGYFSVERTIFCREVWKIEK